MGKALYRKHRSRSLAEVVGQDHITDTLKKALKKGAISHAYLFTGPRGVGKTSVARILAHEINNIDYNDESIHLDIIEIDAASNRRIDEIRDLRDKVHIAPTSAKYKVYIIDEVHMLTREAFNALLKTLEEPPEHVVFILATTEAHKVPETIISRTQRYSFKPIDTEDAIGHLKSIAKLERIKITDEAVKLIAEHGRGSFRDSISILDQLSGLDKDTLNRDDVTLLLGLPDDDVIESVLLSVVNNNPSDLFSAIIKLREQGVGPAQATKALSTKLRNGVVSGNSPMSHKKTVKLLREMLPLTVSSNDFVELELCLLDAMDISSSVSTKQQKVETQKPEPIPEIKIEEKANIQAKKSVVTKTAAPISVTNKTQKTRKAAKPPTTPNNFDKKAWEELLDDLKKHHNTLYGVLRMANPSHDGERLVLSFNFGFHKNRVDTPKNNALLRKFIEKYFGSPEFATFVEVKKDQKKKAIDKPKNKPDELVTSVSNIFKGAQLLES